MISSIIQTLFKIKIQHYTSEHEKKQQRIYDLLNAKTKLKRFRNNSSFLKKTTTSKQNKCNFLSKYWFA